LAGRTKHPCLIRSASTQPVVRRLVRHLSIAFLPIKMSTFRSEDMKFVKFILNFDCKFELIEQLGHLGCVQFKDLNPDLNAFQRRFVHDVRRAEELQRILKLLHSAIDSVPDLADDFASYEPDAKLKSMRSLGEIEQFLAEKEEELKDLNSKHDALYRHQQEVVEFLEVLNGCKGFMKHIRNESLEGSQGVELKEKLIREKEDGGMQYVAGCIPTSMVNKLSRILARNFRNKVVFVSHQIEQLIFDPRSDKSHEKVSKTVFMCFYHYPAFTPKIVKLVETFSATKYTIPESSFERDRLRNEFETKLESMEKTLSTLNDYRRQSLGRLVPLIDSWDHLVRVHKGSACALNLFKYTEGKGSGRVVEGQGWVAASEMEVVLEALAAGARNAKSSTSSYLVEEIAPGEHDIPPTYWKTNKLTAGYQGMINAYGCARYKELNPAIFSVITFPFMFGVMFGDSGHGFLMALMAGYLIYKEGPIAADKKKNEIFGMIFGGRYLIFMMGLFGLYMGTVYNDTFSVAFKAGDSQFTDCSNYVEDCPPSKCPPTKCTRPYLDNVVYPFGFDPMWSHSSNKLSYQNSVKMKQAIVLGVVHMSLGIFCKLFNLLYYNKKPQIFLIWIPEFVFMTFIFGYLVIIIFVKWGINWDDRYILNNDRILQLDSGPLIGKFHWPQGNKTSYVDPVSGCKIIETLTNLQPELMKPELYNQSACVMPDCSYCSLWKQYPPSLLDTLIKFFMSMGQVETPKLVYAGQSGVQTFLLVFAFLQLPILLLGEPLWVKKQMKHQDVKEGGMVHDNYVDFHDQDPESNAKSVQLNVWGEEVPYIPEHPHEYSEIVIHQIIHTIEYALGCISNTASYLRLWALSLAHQQLSEVFWDKLVVEQGLKSPAFLFITTGMWAGMTFGILMYGLAFPASVALSTSDGLFFSF
jgi:V-type H+-transporting ATPase subunit a